MHTGSSFWRLKTLIACALRRFGVAQCCSQASLSKRAPSTTRTSLHFRINDLRAVSIELSHTPTLVPNADAITFVLSELK
jgi:hypothetical protein